MRGDVYVREVLAKCEALKAARVWPAEPRLRPRAWLNNFDESDRPLAAILLDNFTFYPDEHTNRLLVSSYNSLADGLPKGPSAPGLGELLSALPNAVFTRVEGRDPSPTDSGNLFCRKARQELRIPEESFVEPVAALESAISGRPVIFLDDLVASGDQFVGTWQRQYRCSRATTTFAEVHAERHFVPIYVTLITTKRGLTRLHTCAPGVAVTAAHILDETSTLWAIKNCARFQDPCRESNLLRLLEKYSSRMQSTVSIYGYKDLGLMFAFEHSIPDATIPIFWADGGHDWTPLVERR